MNYATQRQIRTWNEDDRPREKMLSKGVSVLSNAELLAILLGSGTREVNALDLAKYLLADFDNDLFRLGREDVTGLLKYKGIGRAKAVAIVAAFELGRRRKASSAQKISEIRSSKAAYDIIHPVIGDLQHEEFWVIMLNNYNRVMGKYCFSKGGITGTVVDLRRVFKRAMEQNAIHVILAHNHPSGNPKPSAHDRTLTKKFLSAGEILDIRVLDHIIVAENQYYSFSDEGEL